MYYNRSMSTKTSTQNEDTQKFANLIGPTEPSVDREARERLITARVGLLLKQPFFGNLATRLQLTNADEWCATAATDGRKFYYNARFIMMLEDEKECEFLFGHEVLHCVYEHIGRRVDNNHEAQLANIAADYCVNGDLVKHKVGRMITTVPCLHDEKYYGWSYEKVYKDLYDNAEKIDIGQLVDQMLDEHLENDQSTAEGGNKEKQEKKEGEQGSGKPTISENELKDIKDELKEALVNAAKATEAGKLPAGVKQIINDITEPQMDWRDLLRMNIESTIKSDYSFQRVNRKSWHVDAVMPGMVNDQMIDIVCAIDLSGSIMSEAKDFLGELKGITEQFNNFRVHVFCFDTDVYNPQDYSSDNLDDITDYELQGGGGTDFECIFKYLKDNQINPERLVVFTDGYPWNTWGDANYCETLWIIHSNDNPNPPFGTWAKYEKSDAN